MRNKLLLIILAILCLQDGDGVNAEFCPDDVTAGKCFKENIIPLVIGATTVGFAFGFIIVVVSFCLFFQTKVKNGEINWVHDREPSSWVKECQNLGIENRGHELERRKQGLDDNKPRHFVSDRSLYSERATTSVFPSSNASEIMNAMDEIQDEETRLPSGYYWAPAVEGKETEFEYEATTSRNVHSAQILHHKKSRKETDERRSSDGSTYKSIYK